MQKSFRCLSVFFVFFSIGTNYGVLLVLCGKVFAHISSAGSTISKVDLGSSIRKTHSTHSTC